MNENAELEVKLVVSGVVEMSSASLSRMAAEAELLVGNLILKELGWETAELYRAALEAREMANIDRKAQAALEAGEPVSKTVAKALRQCRKRLARAMFGFALRGG